MRLSRCCYALQRRTPLQGGKPLQRRSQLARGNSELKRASELPRTTKLKPRSDKRAELYRDERVPLVKALLEDGGPHQCEFPLGCNAVATTVHEYLSRGQGGAIVGDGNRYFRSCVFHNEWAESHTFEAHDIGWRYSRKRASQEGEPNA